MQAGDSGIRIIDDPRCIRNQYAKRQQQITLS